MALLLSPKATATESDAGVGVVQAGNTTAATVISALWGPVNYPVLTTGGEAEILTRYGKPDNNTYLGWFTAKDFSTYCSQVLINRITGHNAINAAPVGMTPVLVKNDDYFQIANLQGYQFIGRYPGSPANGIIIDVADSLKFQTWAYKSNFTYTPGAGQFAVAVIDSTGYWQGSGASNQSETLAVTGTAVGGIKQTQSVAFTGTASGGIQQQETLSISGVATGTSIVVNGTTVTLVIGDTAVIAAGKIATALAAITATYSSAVAIGSSVQVVFSVPAIQSPIASVTQNGISILSNVIVSGNPQFSISIYGVTFQTNNGDSATIVAANYFAALQASNLVTNVVATNATTVTFTFVAYGPYTITASQVISGLTIATTVGTAGSNSINISVFGVTVAILNGDTQTVVATKIAAALLAASGFNSLYTSIQAVGSTVTYTWISGGAKTALTAPVTQSSLSFYVTIKQPGTLGTLIEKYELMQNIPGATNSDGSSAYAVKVINAGSNLIWYGDTTKPLVASTTTLAGGVDDNVISVYSTGLTPFSNKTKYTISYILAGHFDVPSQQLAIQLAETRRDCVAYVDPPLSACYDPAGNQVANITQWCQYELNADSTYSIRGDNWGLTFDAYNDTNRWIPEASGAAGLQAAMTQQTNAWSVAAGNKRGRYKNFSRIAWSASETDRDLLFPLGINSTINEPGIGIVKWGDKTGTQTLTNYEAENIRYAFIQAETDILAFSKNYIFELNDPFVQLQFERALNSYLGGMVRQNAFAEYKVIVDSTNNTILTESEHQLNGTLLIRPVYSIRFVQLNFVAVGGTMTISEVATSMTSV